MHITGPDRYRVMHVDADGPAIAATQDVLDLIGATWGQSVKRIALPVARLDPEFFRLGSGLAGELLQKFVNYEVPVAIVGDIRAHVEASDALRDFVWESNRGTHVWFVDDDAALEARLQSVL